MATRVSDEVCCNIQQKMLELEQQIDKLRHEVWGAGRATSALDLALKDLHQACVKVHRVAGLEQER